METIIGFIAGYLVGSQEGKAGKERLLESWNAISTSAEVRKMTAEALSIVGAMARQASGRGIGIGNIGELGETVTRMVLSRGGSADRRTYPRAA